MKYVYTELFDSIKNINIKGLQRYSLFEVNSKEFILQIKIDSKPMPIFIALRNEILKKLQVLNQEDITICFEVVQ